MALALGAAACGSSDGGDAAAPAADAPQEETASADGGETAPSSVLDISASAVDGTALNLSDYAGQDLMLWFWAPW